MLMSKKKNYVSVFLKEKHFKNITTIISNQLLNCSIDIELNESNIS